MTNNTHKYTSTVTLKQETPQGPVLLDIAFNPTMKGHTNNTPVCYQIMSSMYSAMQVNLIQEGFELARELANPKYNVVVEMGQDDIEGEVFTTLKLDPIDVSESETPVSYLVTSSLLLQLLEDVGVVDEDGNMIADEVRFVDTPNDTVH